MIQVIGYGSLMIADSFAKTLAPRAFRSVWVSGYRRVFNLKTRLLKLYGVKEASNQVAILNAVPDEHAQFNALIFEVAEDELHKLELREALYYTKPVPVEEFASHTALGDSLLFIGQKLYHGERVVSDEYLPIPSYLERVRQAAYLVNEAFGKAFDETTFLGDGRTLAQYLAQPI